MNDTTDTTAQAEPATAPAPAPLLRMLQLPGLPEAEGDVPVCGPDGCAVPGATAPEQP